MSNKYKLNKKRERFIVAFENETTEKRVIYRFTYGFFGVGELKVPRDHIQKGVNDIIVRCYNRNMNDSDVVEQWHCEINRGELEKIHSSIGEFLELC